MPRPTGEAAYGAGSFWGCTPYLVHAARESTAPLTHSSGYNTAASYLVRLAEKAGS